jgi:uncharacterized membrane protein YoaK (UPF0700 family)
MSKPVLILVSVLLTWIAGFVDAVGFIALGRVYTANMSGNSIAVGIQTFDRNWLEALVRLWPVITYVIGLLLCRVLLELGARRKIRRMATVTLALEIMLLGLVCFAKPQGAAVAMPAAFSIGILAVAMGIQNGTLTHFSFVTVHTGFVTGTLVKMAEELARYMAWLWDKTSAGSVRWREALRFSRHEESFQRSVLLAGLWLAYVVGALSGAFGNHLANLRSLAVPVASLAVVIALDLRSPLAVKEEQAQIEGPRNG